MSRTFKVKCDLYPIDWDLDCGYRGGSMGGYGTIADFNKAKEEALKGFDPENFYVIKKDTIFSWDYDKGFWEDEDGDMSFYEDAIKSLEEFIEPIGVWHEEELKNKALRKLTDDEAAALKEHWKNEFSITNCN